MDIVFNIFVMACGFAFLIAGAELLVRGGSGIARAFGINPLVVGLTIVAYGTSMPEFMASVVATMKGVSGIALGNVLGSNIFNIAVVLGVIAVMHPVEIEREIVFVQIPIMLAITVIVVLMGWTGTVIGRLEGLILSLGVISYTIFSFYRSRRKIIPIDFEMTDFWAGHRAVSFGAVLAGCLLLFIGGKWVVESATFVAERIDVPPRIIGATIVAVGTSLPELITSMVGIIRREMDIGVGNAIGSCVFNLLMVIGGSALFRPLASDWSEFRVELGFAFASGALIWLLARKNRLLRQMDGITLLLLYGLFMWLILH
ncbi:sodium:calcium antiporter [bacterium]|nr:sodium:calcium antiporter [candidate division CSSED10-310 bacterium]